MSEYKSYLITGPPMRDKNHIVQSLIDTSDINYQNVLTLSTDNKKATENSDLLAINSGNLPPSDFTEIGIQTSKWLQSHQSPNAIILEDLTTFEMYVKKETLFRFLHVITKRIKSENSTLLVLQTIEEGQPNVYRELFDEVLSIESYTPTD